MSMEQDIDLVGMVERIKTSRAYSAILRHMDSIRLIGPHGDSTWLVPYTESADMLHEAAKHPEGQVARAYAMSLGAVVELLDRLGLIPDDPINEQERAEAVTKVLDIMEKHSGRVLGTDTGNTNGEGI